MKWILGQNSSIYSEQSEARLIDFDECDSSVFSNELDETQQSNEVDNQEQQAIQNDGYNDDIPNISILNEEEVN